MNKMKLTGLVAATHTPFNQDGSLNLSAVETQASHLLANGVESAFIGGTTGEWSSLTLEERLALTTRWIDVAHGSKLKIIVHAGANCLSESQTLAAHAQKVGALATSAVSPNYFKPRDVGALVDSMALIASAASEIPFYYYELPMQTGVTCPPSKFLSEASATIPNLAGLKFSSTNFLEFQLCLRMSGGEFDVPFGCDEMLLAALSLGGICAVGSTYNFAAPIYHRMIRAFTAGDLKKAREEQFRSARLVDCLSGHGFMGAAKATMKMLGVDVGPARLPNRSLTETQRAALRAELENIGFFDWVRTTTVQ